MQTRPRIANGLKSKNNGNTTYFEYPLNGQAQETYGDKIIYTRHDHKQIAPGKYLNDTIISFFMQYHFDKQVPQELKPKLHVFNSFFFQKIKSIRQNKTSFAHASKWLGSVRIFDKDFLILPVCEKDHWVLVIVCYPANIRHTKYNEIPDDELFEPAVIVLNSCVGLTPTIKKPICEFLKFQWAKERMPEPGEERSFIIHNAKSNGIRLIFPELPQQKNSSDCGVYILGYFYSFLRDPRAAYVKMFRNINMRNWFKQNDIDISRERRAMSKVVNDKIREWAESKKRSMIINLDMESQEVHRTTPNSSAETVEYGYRMDDDPSIIVLN